MNEEKFVPTTLKEFRIGAIVMCDFGNYHRPELRVGKIINETKTLWKVEFKTGVSSFDKVSGRLKEVHWNTPWLEPYNEDKVIEQKRLNMLSNLKYKLSQGEFNKLSSKALKDIWRIIYIDLEIVGKDEE